MLNLQTMTPEQEQQARAQAFYLLKKFTSYTFLDKARAFYQGYLDAYANLLNDPTYLRKRIWYKEFLSFMTPIEEGLQLLRTTPHKLEAYGMFEGCTRPISQYLFGRGAHEIGISYEPFFQSLGMQEEDSDKPDVGVIRDVLIMTNMVAIFESTVFDRLIVNTDTWKGAMAFNYETLFVPSYFKPLPAQKLPNQPHIYPFNFPKDLPPCPPHNTNSAGQVWSDGEILVTGIYEPWLLNGKVGCPNYFLAGQKAIEYQLEGTQDKETVSWRLLWEDKRYLDGSIPPEEDQYLREPQPDPLSQKAVLSAQPGQPCPQEGVWFAPHLQMKEVHMKQGEPMPAALNSPTGAVIWYLKR